MELKDLQQLGQTNPDRKKIRLAITYKGKGKSGGARVITFVKVTRNTVYLTSIFDKTEKDNITNKELEQIFKLIP